LFIFIFRHLSSHQSQASSFPLSQSMVAPNAILVVVDIDFHFVFEMSHFCFFEAGGIFQK